jgi:hypothetical protein
MEWYHWFAIGFIAAVICGAGIAGIYVFLCYKLSPIYEGIMNAAKRGAESARF